MRLAGVDFDVETMTGDAVTCANVLAEVVDAVRASGTRVSFAPQVVRTSSYWGEGAAGAPKVTK